MLHSHSLLVPVPEVYWCCYSCPGVSYRTALPNWTGGMELLYAQAGSTVDLPTHGAILPYSHSGAALNHFSMSPGYQSCRAWLCSQKQWDSGRYKASFPMQSGTTLGKLSDSLVLFTLNCSSLNLVSTKLGSNFAGSIFYWTHIWCAYKL